jgi:hypothetical protein
MPLRLGSGGHTLNGLTVADGAATTDWGIRIHNEGYDKGRRGSMDP